MAENANLVLTLTALSVPALDAIQQPHNKKYYVCSPASPICAPSLQSTVSSPATNIGDWSDGEGDEYESKSRFDITHELHFTFDRKPKNIERGWVFGSNTKKCDILLGTSKHGISATHFRITFNIENQLVLIDRSTHGTAVMYDGKGRQEKRENPPNANGHRDEVNDFQWALSSAFEHRIVLGEHIATFPEAPIYEFMMKVANHDSSRKQHDELRNTYLNEARTAVPFSLYVDSHPTTAGNTATNSPKVRTKQKPVWILGPIIGDGTFGTVHKLTNVSSLKVYAAKYIMRTRKGWEKEPAILRRLSHNHIVKFEDYDKADSSVSNLERPRIIMEYLPLGNLAFQNEINRIQEWETVSLVCQVLDALSYLHSQAIVHRDLKPENILIYVREVNRFSVKVADFGLAREGSILQTVCGTKLYVAPEVCAMETERYTAKVDIWSLGVIGFQYVYDLPDWPASDWHDSVVKKAEDCDENFDPFLQFLLSCMLKIDPEERSSAKVCHARAITKLVICPPKQVPEVDPGSPTVAESSTIVNRCWQQVRNENERRKRPGESGESAGFPTLTTIADLEERVPTGARHCLSFRAQSSWCTNQSKRPRTDQDEMPSLIRITVNGHTVSMRNSDYWLCATEILELIGESDTTCRRIARFIQQKAPEYEIQEKGSRNILWIPFTEGVVLAQCYGLTKELLPLLQQEQPDVIQITGQKKYHLPAFINIEIAQQKIPFRTKDSLLNVTKMLKAAGLDPLKEMIKKENRKRGERISSGNVKWKGTYMSVPDALAMCDWYKLFDFKGFLLEELKEWGYDHQVEKEDEKEYETGRTGEVQHEGDIHHEGDIQHERGIQHEVEDHQVDEGRHEEKGYREDNDAYLSELGNNSFLPVIKTSSQIVSF